MVRVKKAHRLASGRVVVNALHLCHCLVDGYMIITIKAKNNARATGTKQLHDGLYEEILYECVPRRQPLVKAHELQMTINHTHLNIMTGGMWW